MGQHEFEIKIEADGCVTMHARGFKGKSCSEVVKLFEQIVGEIRSEQKTSEFYEPDEVVRFQIDQKA
jgi:hypothetical protein